MPQISRFLGIIITMYAGDHNPPHFHALYAEYDVEIGINDFRVLAGSMPNRVLGLVLEWASMHRDELFENWRRIENEESVVKIAPLV